MPKNKEIFKLTNVRMAGNEHKQLKADVIYADLNYQNGNIYISATLQYVLQKIRDRKLKVDGIAVEWEESRGANCSIVSLDKYERKIKPKLVEVK